MKETINIDGIDVPLDYAERYIKTHVAFIRFNNAFYYFAQGIIDSIIEFTKEWYTESKPVFRRKRKCNFINDRKFND